MNVYTSGVKNIRQQIMANLEMNTLDRRFVNKLGYIKNRVRFFAEFLSLAFNFVTAVFLSFL